MAPRTYASFSRRATLAWLGAALTALVGSPAATVPREAHSTSEADRGPGSGLKILLHVSDDNGWPAILSNLKNLTRNYAAAQVRVVADGSSVYALHGATDFTSELAGYAKAGVDIRVCHNALDDHGIDPRTVPAYAHVVPAGVVDLVESQNAGFRYVKP